jgi:hypothetical protein
MEETMKSSGLVTACAFIALIALWSDSVIPQEVKKEAADKAITVTDILKKAECPLTEAQTKQLKDLDLTKGREVFQTLFGMFDQKQTEALKKALGTRPGTNDRPDTPRYLFQVVIFEKTQCPITEKQLEALKALPMDSSARDKMNEILTDKQKEEMQKLFSTR